MKVKGKKGEQEVIIDPEDRELISAADENLKSLSNDEIELIESILEPSKYHFDISNVNPNLLTSIGNNLHHVISPQAAVVLLNFISNSEHINIVLNRLKEEDLISEKSSKLILRLSAKYGVSYSTLLLNIERPKNWTRINSNVFFAGDIMKLQSKIWRVDGEVFEFDAQFDDSITLAGHFIRKTLEMVKKFDKEKILELNESQISDLEKQIVELKELHISVKSDIDKIEGTKEASTDKNV